MSVLPLLRFVVLSITCVAGFMLIDVFVVSRLRVKKMYSVLLIFLYLSGYWSIVYLFFLD